MPKEYSEFAASLGLEGIGLPKIPGIAAAAAPISKAQEIAQAADGPLHMYPESRSDR